VDWPCANPHPCGGAMCFVVCLVEVS